MASREDSLEKIELNRRSAALRPKRYESQTGAINAITDEFERYLIVAEDLIKKRASKYMESSSTKLTARNEFRNAVLAEFSNTRTAALQKDINYFKQEISKQQEVVTQLKSVRLSDSESLPSPELTDILTDIRIANMELAKKLSDAKILLSRIDYFQGLASLDEVTSSSIQRMRNWSNSLLDYLNLEEPGSA